MHRFRATACLARFVLAWFALSLGVALASPLIQPRALQLICSAGAVKLMQQQDEGVASTVALALDCALCSLALAPPPRPVRVAVAPLAPAGGKQLAPGGSEVEALLRPPARGPPAGGLG